MQLTTYHLDLSTAWYAASLASTQTIIGEALRFFRSPQVVAGALAVIPGDNIGPEVAAAGCAVLRHVQDLGFCRFTFETYPWGAEHYLRTGRAAPENLVEILRPFDAIYFGAHGDPSRVPDKIGSQQLMHPIRNALELYVNLRPARLYPGIASPLRAPGAIDLVVVRENTEGEYANVGGRVHRGTAHEAAMQTTVVTRHGAARVMRYALWNCGTRYSRRSRLSIRTSARRRAT